MSDLTFLVADSFLVIGATFLVTFSGKIAADKSAEIITGVVKGIRVSPAMREGMLFGIWLPWHTGTVGFTAFLALTQLEMANHVTDPNVKQVAYFFAFLAAVVSVAALVLNTVGLFAQRAKVRRDALRQAEAD